MDLMFYIQLEARSCAESQGLTLMENLRVDVARGRGREGVGFEG